MHSAGQIQAFVGANASDIGSGDSAYWETLDGHVVTWLSDVTGRHLGDVEEDLVETVDGLGDRKVWVEGFIRATDDSLRWSGRDREPGEAAVWKVEVRSSLGAAWVELDRENWEAEPGRDWIRRLDGCFPQGEALVRVTYDTGYTSTAEIDDPENPGQTIELTSDAPAKLKRLVLLLCGVWHRTRPYTRGTDVAPLELRDVPDSARLTIQLLTRRTA